MKREAAILALFAGLLAQARSDTVYMKDGTIWTNVAGLREVGAAFLFEKGGRMDSLPKHKVDRILTADGQVVYRSEKLTVERAGAAADVGEHVFQRNGVEVGRGRWDGDGMFVVTAGTIPEGIYREFHASGKLRAEYPVKAGRLNGVCRTYYESGRVEKEGTFLNGKEDGVSRLFYESGQLQGESVFSGGRRDGLTRLYYESGKLRGEMAFAAGLAEGLTRMFYASGLPELETAFKAGRKHGTLKKYYESGALRMEAEYQDGELEGEVKSYYESGKLKSVERFRHGKVL